MIIPIAVTLTLTVLTLLVCYVRRKLNYWDELNVPNNRPKTPLGDLIDCFRRKTNVYKLFEDYGHEFKRKGHRFYGFYFTVQPIFVPIDYDLLKTMMTRDHDYFPDRGIYLDTNRVPFGETLFSCSADRWRFLRQMYVNSLTIGRLKSVRPLIAERAAAMCDVIGRSEGEPINMFDISLRYVLDIVIPTLYGAEMNCLKTETAPYQYVKGCQYVKLMNILKVCLRYGLKNPAYMIVAYYIDEDVNGFITDFARKLYEARKRSHERRKDFLDELIDAYESDSVPFDFNTFAAQIFISFLAAFETTSTTLTNVFYLLAKSQQHQDALREELRRAANDSDDDQTNSAPDHLDYLDCIILESSRLHTVTPMVNRVCAKDYKVPESDLIIKAGTPVFISINTFHRDPEYFPNPLVFDPDRYKHDPEQYQKLLTFGIGQHYCVGKVLAKASLKRAIRAVLSRFEIKVNEKLTGKRLEDVTFTRKLTASYKNTIWLEFHKLKDGK